jgi:hypothetical protein
MILLLTQRESVLPCLYSYHVVVKVKLNKNLSINATYEAIITKTKKLVEEYNKRINNNQKSKPTLIDKMAFQVVSSLLTHYTIEKAIVE